MMLALPMEQSTQLAVFWKSVKAGASVIVGGGPDHWVAAGVMPSAAVAGEAFVYFIYCSICRHSRVKRLF